MKTQGNRTFMGTVVFLDLGEAASASPMPELHQRVRDVVSRTVGHLPATERILLDTGNGAVVCFPGDPEDAVFVAIGIRDSLQQEMVAFPAMQVRVGVNLGPVKVLEEAPGHTQLLGEGMHGAEALLSFAAPSQILASRSFFELVSSLSDEYRELFHHHGARRLPGARDVDLYELAPVGGSRAMADSTWPAGGTPPAVPIPLVPARAVPAPAPAAAAPTPGDAGGWRSDALTELSAALARAMGPLAPVLIKRSAQKTDDPRILCEILAEALTDDADRNAFIAFSKKWMAGARKSSPPMEAIPAPPSPATAARVASRLNPQDRAKLEAALAPHVGPIARVLVERAAHEAPDLAAASHTLAASLPEGEQRRTFLRTLTLVQPPTRTAAVKKVVPPPAPPPPAASKVAVPRAPAMPTQGLGGTQPLLGTLYLGEDVLRRAEQTLARLVGPMARPLVRRVAKNARTSAELYAALAEELPEGPERERFLASQ
jgi:class 3 adenylate cyclase